MRTVYLSGRVWPPDKLLGQSWLGPATRAAVRLVDADGEDIEGVVGVMLAFESPEAVVDFDRHAPVIELWCEEG